MANDDNLFDKMIEMSMGMTMASQIPQMVNAAMPKPTSQTTPPPVQGALLQMYVLVNNNQVGPLSEQEVINLIQKGVVTESTLVWKAGMSKWLIASQVPEMGKLLLLYKK
ncbi:MAG: DUF4339 domain-containing protein [Bacteroidales bacterium]|nr:DUF4339 domain-containing protein [Bacteroidales bacterium]